MPNLNRAEDDVFLMALEKWRDLHAGELHWDIEVVIDWMVENEEFGLERRIVRRELARKLRVLKTRGTSGMLKER